MKSNGFSGTRPLGPRFVPPLALISVFVILVLLYTTQRIEAYSIILKIFGVQPYVPPFIDTEVVRSAVECHSKRVDVYLSNPCDPVGRVHIYSPLLLYLDRLKFHLASINAIGTALAVLYFVSVLILFKPKTYFQAFFAILGVVSYPAIFAVERGQFDIVIMFLTVMVCLTYFHSLIYRLIGYGLALIIGLLKFFPIVLLGLVPLREPPKRAAVIVSAGLGIFVLTYYLFAAEYRVILERIPHCGFFCDQFWVGNMPFRLLNIGRDNSAAPAVHAVAMVGLFFTICGLGWWASRNGFRPDLSDRDTVFFLAGGLLIGASYVAEANTYYRAIHLLLTLPFLMKFGFEERMNNFTSRSSMILAWNVIFLLWIMVLIKFVWIALKFFGIGVSSTPLPISVLFLLRDFAWFAGVAGIGAICLLAVLPFFERVRGAVWLAAPRHVRG